MNDSLNRFKDGKDSQGVNPHGLAAALSAGASIDGIAARNRVLRNTYLLLAVSLLPTVLGAWVGLATGITQQLRGGLGFVVFLAGALGLIYAIQKNKDRAAGVYWLLAFTFFMGIMLSRLLAGVLGFKNGPSLVMLAFGGTAGIFFVMASLAGTIQRSLSELGQWLFWGLVVVLVAGIINLFLASTVLMAVVSTLSLVVFSAYILYDVKQVMDGGETNYISATLAIYLDLINVFQSLLSLLGIFGGERD